jgi:hypothetical protein
MSQHKRQRSIEEVIAGTSSDPIALDGTVAAAPGPAPTPRQTIDGKQFTPESAIIYLRGRKGRQVLQVAKAFPWMATAAPGLLSLHATSCAAERIWSKWGLVFNGKLRNGLDVQRAAKMIFIAAIYDHGARTSASSDLLVTQRFVQHS